MMTTRTHTAAEDGFTLVEVLVTIVIGMIVLAATLTMLASGFTSSAKVQDRHDTAGRARVSLKLRVDTASSADVQRDNATRGGGYADVGDLHGNDR